MRYATLVNSRLAGTPAWTAPEVLRSEGYNEKSDCFSFGVVGAGLARMRVLAGCSSCLQCPGCLCLFHLPLWLHETLNFL